MQIYAFNKYNKIFILLITSICISQKYYSQVSRIENIEFNIPINYTFIENKNLLIGKAEVKKDQYYEGLLKINSEYDLKGSKTFFYLNTKQNCMNVFQFNLNDFDIEIKKAELLEHFSDTLNNIINDLANSGVNVYKIIEPTFIKNDNGIEIIYFQYYYKLKKPSTGVITDYISDNFILISNNKSFTSYFNSELINYKLIKPIINKYLNSISLN